jgi:hypothetical protein
MHGSAKLSILTTLDACSFLGLNMRRHLPAFLCAALTATAAMLAPPSAHADVIIDTFDHPSPQVLFAAPGFAGLPVVHSHGTILGNRTLSVNSVISAGAFPGGVAIGGGTFEVSSNSLTSFHTFLLYTGGSFGVQDWAGLSGFGLTMLAYNNGSVTTDLTITIFTTTGNLVGTTDFPNVPPGPMQFVVPFAIFAGPGNLGAVTGVQFEFNSGVVHGDSFGFDMALDEIRVIPEPASIAVWSLVGIGGLALARLRKRTPKAVI